MTKAELKRKIDRLGDLREQMATLKAAERELTEQVCEGLTAARLGAMIADRFAAQLAEKRLLQIDAKKFRGKAGDKVFLQCAKVDVKKARQLFGDDVLEKCGEFTTRTELRISRKPGR